jgi:hypothetical protein
MSNTLRRRLLFPSTVYVPIALRQPLVAAEQGVPDAEVPRLPERQALYTNLNGSPPELTRIAETDDRIRDSKEIIVDLCIRKSNHTYAVGFHEVGSLQIVQTLVFFYFMLGPVYLLRVLQKLGVQWDLSSFNTAPR